MEYTAEQYETTAKIIRDTGFGLLGWSDSGTEAIAERYERLAGYASLREKYAKQIGMLDINEAPSVRGHAIIQFLIHGGWTPPEPLREAFGK